MGPTTAREALKELETASHLPGDVQGVTGLDPYVPWLLMIQVHVAAAGLPSTPPTTTTAGTGSPSMPSAASSPRAAPS